MKLDKSPSECKSKTDIRLQIDNIDKEIITLFAQRFQYVSEIVKYKNDPVSIVAQERKDQVINERGEWANSHGLDKGVFEDIYRLLIDHNIEKELEILQKN